MRRKILACLVPVFCAILLVAYAFVGRFVLHGPVTPDSLHAAVSQVSGSAGQLLDVRYPCRRGAEPRTWTCSVYDSAGSGGVDYRVRVSDDSSCFDGQRITDNPGEPAMPLRVSGCVHRWQWTLL